MANNKNVSLDDERDDGVMTGATLRLGEMLVRQNKIRQDQLKVALDEQRTSNKKIGEILVELGFLSQKESSASIGQSVGIETVSLASITPSNQVMALIPETFLKRHKILPFDIERDVLKVAVANPEDILLLDKVRQQLASNMKVIAYFANVEEIEIALDSYFGNAIDIDAILKDIDQSDQMHQLSSQSSMLNERYEHPMVRLVEALLVEAVKNKASDLHLEPNEKYVRIRFRLDGVLHETRVLHKRFWGGVLIRLKVLAELDLTESRVPQDGRIELTVNGRLIEFRVSIFYTHWGESVVLRIHDQKKGAVSLNQLGLSDEELNNIDSMLERQTGLLLVTGPTGAGKTTTLYAVIQALNKESVNIMTLEDPIEQLIPGVRQTAIHEAAGMKFSTGVRAQLRQDPDIMLIGEIRDADTAEIALRAAMTGHQVLSTLHTNSAIGAFSRLKDLGVSHSSLAGNLIGVVGQRLVRVLCEHCKQPHELNCEDKSVFNTFDLTGFNLYQAKGCEHCHHSGYQGRHAVVEIIKVNAEIDRLLTEGVSQTVLLAAIRKQGYVSLLENGMELVGQGKTSLSEIKRTLFVTGWG